MSLYLSSDSIVASSAIASSTMSRPSSVVPIFQNFARVGAAFAERLVIAVDVLRVREFAGRADGAAEELERRGHAYPTPADDRPVRW